MTREEVLQRIRSRGHWRVRLTPSSFDSERIGSLAELEEAVQDAHVQLRGWPYPFFERAVVSRVDDYIQGAVAWNEHNELWRLYQSGQFIHYFSMREDWWDDGVPLSSGHRVEPGTHLSLLSTLFSFTEIFLFSARLTERLALGPEVKVMYSLIGLRNRQLQIFEPGRVSLNQTRRSSEELDELSREVTLAPEELIASAEEFAVDQALLVFERFNWEPARESVLDDQRKFLERRS